MQTDHSIGIHIHSWKIHLDEKKGNPVFQRNRKKIGHSFVCHGRMLK